MLIQYALAVALLTYIAVRAPTLAEGDVVVEDLPRCPYSRWQGDPRYCHECRWCPFRGASCCEIEDEIDVLKSVNVSGSKFWDCFITIVHFQQCGRCDPAARNYTNVSKSVLPWVWHPLNLHIRICESACQYIYRQCSGVTLLSGESFTNLSEEEFIQQLDCPKVSTPSNPCYNAAGSSSIALVEVLIVFLLIGFFLP